jgi:quercetin dioxygenase-like cupin family protein
MIELIAKLLGDGEPSSLAAVVTTTAAGAMPPLHVHDRDEAHHVLAGLLTVQIGEDEVTLGPGEGVVAPAGIPHTFRAERTTRHVTIATARSVARYEDWLRAVAQPATAFSWEHGPEAQALAAIAGVNGITVLGPPGAVSDRSRVLAGGRRT